jgi:hypothetical protein
MNSYHDLVETLKIITHDQHDINVIGIGCGGDVTPEEDEAIQFACGSG